MTASPTEALDEIERGLDAAFDAAADEHALRNSYSRVLGPKGALTSLMKRITELAPIERKPFGQRVNEVKKHAETARERVEAALRAKARAAELASQVDITLPGRKHRVGRMHPIARVMHDVVDVFREMGFDVAEGPEIEYADYNFDKLGFPPDHPAMDMQDSFFVDTGTPERRALLRTHTSPVQIREMLSHPPPVMMVAPGAVYRRDDDATHSPMFTQLEGLVVDRGISMGHLKGVLETFAQRCFGPDVPTNFRASYFPFVEPGAELDVGCLICHGKDAACRVCKGTGWLEILGGGMVHPVVFENVGYDPEEFTGFAFGMGIDRIAMLRYGIPNIRLLFENDVRFLQSF